MSAAAAIKTELKTHIFAASAWRQVAPVWAALERQCPRASFFLSEVWVETWLEVFGAGLNVSILVFETGGRAVEPVCWFPPNGGLRCSRSGESP